VSAETLRRAAALMRARAEAEAQAESGWNEWPRRDIEQDGTCDGCAEQKALVAAYDDPTGDNEPWLCAGCAAETDHIQSWHPAVALAVADWLEGVAARIETKIRKGGSETGVWSHEKHALTVARAYLGEA